MTALLSWAVPISTGAVFLVLLGGLYTLWRGHSPSLSQKMMRWRVGLQFLAICIAMLAVYLKRGA